MTSPQDLLRAVAVFGDYFAVVDQPVGGWPTLATLAADADALNERVSETRAALAAQCRHGVEQIQPRVAASVWFLGCAARIVSPPFAVAVASGQLPRLSAECVWAPPSGPCAMRANDGTRSHDLYDIVLVGLIEPLVRSVQATFAVSPQVLWGNVASSLDGAATVIGLTRPDLFSVAQTVVEGLLGEPLLVNAGSYDDGRFRRNNCCLYYRLPNGGLCGDCVLLTT